MKKNISIFTAFFLTLLSSFSYQKIVCLSPSACELFYETGNEELLVARNDFCDFPPDAKKLPSMGGFDGKTLSIEKIVAQKPDLVFGSKGMHDFLKEPLAKFGIDIYLENISSLSELENEILYIGKISKNEAASKKLVEKIEEKILEIKKSSEKNAPEKTPPKKVFWEIWSEPLMTVGKDAFITEVLKLCGGENIFSQLSQDYPMVSSETVIKLNPDIIVLQSDSTENIETIKKRYGWNRINAVKNRKVVKLDSDTISRPSRILTLMDEICDILK